MKKIAILIISYILCHNSIFTDETVCFEAENTATIEKPMTVAKVRDKAISKGQFIEVKQGAGEGTKVGGKASYKINLETGGKFILWARVWWLDGCGNSFSVAVDKGRSFTFGNDNTFKSWHWVKSRVKLNLQKGEHILTVSNREDGIKIDQFLLTDDKKFVPVDIEDSTKLAD